MIRNFLLLLLLLLLMSDVEYIRIEVMKSLIGIWMPFLVIIETTSSASSLSFKGISLHPSLDSFNMIWIFCIITMNCKLFIIFCWCYCCNCSIFFFFLTYVQFISFSLQRYFIHSQTGIHFVIFNFRCACLLHFLYMDMYAQCTLVCHFIIRL